MATDQDQSGAAANEEITTYTGTAEEVGAQLFADALGPTLQEAMDSTPDKRGVARMYAGMLAGFTGMLSQHFGHQAALDMLRGTADNLEKRVASGEIQAAQQTH